MCSLVPMQDTTTGFNIFSNLKSITNEFAIPLGKIIGISTDGAKAVSSMEVGVAGRLFQKIKTSTGNEILFNHCIIHQENLCAERPNLLNVTEPVIKMINFIRSRALNHRQFKDLLKELDADCNDVIYNTEVRWLSRGPMLKRVCCLKNEIQLFLNMKEYDFPYIEDQEWMCDFGV